MRKVGITGTRNGMTQRQIDGIKQGLTVLFNTEFELAHAGDTEFKMEFHHGDCIGADVEAAMFAQELGYKTISHPPTKEDLRAWHDSDVILKPDSYFSRNRNIVDSVDFLFVAPYQIQEIFEASKHGGTKYTYDYARKKKDMTIMALWP